LKTLTIPERKILDTPMTTDTVDGQSSSPVRGGFRLVSLGVLGWFVLMIGILILLESFGGRGDRETPSQPVVSEAVEGSNRSQ
jgi:hypothetical protein